MIVTVIAYLLSGHRGIYPAQRIARGKHGQPLAHTIALRDVGESLAHPRQPPPSLPPP
jgi:chloride channel protein, CIC family